METRASTWGSDVPPLVWQRVLELAEWERDVSGAFRATCTTWRGVHDTLLPRLEPQLGSTADEWMCGRWGRFPLVETVKLWLPTTDVFIARVPELQSLPALTKLHLVFFRSMRGCDMQALAQSLPKLSSLSIADLYDEDSDEEEEEEEEEEGDDVVGLSALSSLQSLISLKCWSGSRSLVSREGLGALKSLTGLRTLQLYWPGTYDSTVTDLGALGNLTAWSSISV
jgi:hypothetical protein